jgi:hypothetical protein
LPVGVIRPLKVIANALSAGFHLIAHRALPRPALRMSVDGTILIAFAKTYFIGQDFMELRRAPKPLRTAFVTWVVVIGIVAAGLYII